MKQILILIIFLCFFAKIFSQSTVEKSGDILQLAIPLAAYSTSLILKDKTGQHEFYKSFALSLGTTYLLKYSIKKERPNHRGYDSFPSGHTSAAFQGASFIQMRYGWKYGAPAYVAASFVGYTRVEAKQHYVEDVVAGAVIGVLSNLIFTKKYSKNDLQIIPIVSRKAFGIGVSFNF